MKSKDGFEITVVSSPEYKRCVAEIWCDNEVFAIVSNDDDFERVEIIPRQKGDWDFQYAELLSIMDKAMSLVRMNGRVDDENDE